MLSADLKLDAELKALTPIGRTSVTQFDEIIRTNSTGVFFTIQAAAQHLNEGASIILYRSTKHPVVRSLEPGEDWRWCYVDEALV